jgi:chromosome segregation ATPase
VDSDNVSFELLGEQMKRLQELTRLDRELDALIEVTDDRFDRIDQRFVELFRLLNEQFAAVKNDIEALRQG